MGEKIIVGPEFGGLVNAIEPFAIDNKSFPFLLNAYEWRNKIKRKRGTATIGRLQRTLTLTIVLDGSGFGNVLNGLEPNANLVVGSVTITDTTAIPQNVYTDPMLNGILVGSPAGGTGDINYSAGVFVISAAAGHTVTVVFSYNPSLPVMGLRSLNLQGTEFPGSIAFDTSYSYSIGQTDPINIHDITFYKNPQTAAVPVLSPPYNYVQKTTATPFTWNGANYQQFYSTNYENAFWATNGITVPFNPSTTGMQFRPIVSITVSNAGPPASAVLNITANNLVVGDFLFINEVTGIPGINFQTGYVTNVAANLVTVVFPNANFGGSTTGTGGIAQYLTNSANPSVDCIRWYDGDPTLTTSGSGWVNFSPPLSQFVYNVSELPAKQYYLVGARLIVPFKGALLCFGPVIQASTGSSIYLQETIIWSEFGTPYYTASFAAPAGILPNTSPFVPMLTPGYGVLAAPVVQPAIPQAWWEDIIGFGGYLFPGYQQPILTVSPNEDVLIVGFSSRQSRLIYTGDNINPFNIFIVNSELGSGSTFSTINLDRGVMTLGEHGFVIANQIGAERFDLDIPDEVFEFSLLNQGQERITAQRDFINEWIYFTYCSNQDEYVFPNQTLQYNYREKTWAVFRECYTTYGQFRHAGDSFTWAEVFATYPTWQSWTDPWNAGVSTPMQPVVIAGTPQGYVIERASGTAEGSSIYINEISESGGITTITSPNHCLNDGDYFTISGAIQIGGPPLNGQIFSVMNATVDTFDTNPTLLGSPTYLGGGQIMRMYVPLIQTKQFNPSWSMERKSRIGKQQYLFSRTPNGQVTVYIFLSENNIGYGDLGYNFGPVIPASGSLNNSLIYSTVVYTCPELTNIGLTPPNINLQQVTGAAQQQIWHRMNTSLIGDTVQIGITLSDAQMRDPTFSNQFVEIELHCIVLDLNPSQLLA